jgi:class 3 adenylate cyclase
VAGYSRLTRADEKGALEQLQAHRDQFVYPKIAEHSGRIERTSGDSLLVEFESPTEAVRCAVELQRGMIDRNIRTLPDRRITFRVGIGVGQATANGGDLVSRAVAALPRDTLATLIKPGAEFYSEPGNMAVRLAGLAEPAGICISEAVQDAIRDQLQYIFKDIGKQNLEVGAAPVHCYAMTADAVASSPRFAAQDPHSRPKRLRSAAVAVSVFAAAGIGSVALFAWLGANSPTAVTPGSTIAGSPAPSPPMSSTAVDTSQAPPVSQTPLANATAADIDTQAAQSSLASNAVDGSIQALSSRPDLSEIAGIVVRGKQEPSALQSTPDNGTAAVKGIQAPTVLQPTLNSGVAVVRGKQEATALQITPENGAAVVRGTQAPPTQQIAPEAATDVVRGSRVSSGPPPSSRPDQR